MRDLDRTIGVAIVAQHQSRERDAMLLARLVLPNVILVSGPAAVRHRVVWSYQALHPVRVGYACIVSPCARAKEGHGNDDRMCEQVHRRFETAGYLSYVRSVGL